MINEKVDVFERIIEPRADDFMAVAKEHDPNAVGYLLEVYNCGCVLIYPLDRNGECEIVVHVTCEGNVGDEYCALRGVEVANVPVSVINSRVIKVLFLTEGLTKEQERFIRDEVGAIIDGPMSTQFQYDESVRRN